MNDRYWTNRAKSLAHWAHDSIGQVRKYTGEPYWVHTDRVAILVDDHGGTDAMIAAAHLHDVLEDVEPELIKRGMKEYSDHFRVALAEFPSEVRNMVVELTHEFTQEKYPKLNRAQRKKLEADRLALVSRNSKTIKLADLIDNSDSIVKHDIGFARTYLREKEYLLGVLREGEPRLLAQAERILRESLDKLGMV